MKPDIIPEAQSIGEINIHLGYIRNELVNLNKSVQELDKHYVTFDEFKPLMEALKKSVEDVESLKTYRDTLSGKIIGVSISASLVIGIVLTLIKLWLKI